MCVMCVTNVMCVVCVMCAGIEGDVCRFSTAAQNRREAIHALMFDQTDCRWCVCVCVCVCDMLQAGLQHNQQCTHTH